MVKKIIKNLKEKVSKTTSKSNLKKLGKEIEKDVEDIASQIEKKFDTAADTFQETVKDLEKKIESKAKQVKKSAKKTVSKVKAKTTKEIENKKEELKSKTKPKTKKSVKKSKPSTKKSSEQIPKMKVVMDKKSYYSNLDLDSKGLTRNGFGEGLLQAGKKNKNVVALCADLTGSVKVDKFAKKYPNRFFEMGICEQNMMGAAAGMCLNGKIPVVASYAAFNPGRNFDQLRVSVCYSNHPVKVLGGHAGLTTGPDGATHQALEDISQVRALPNLDIIVPCDEIEAKKATIAMLENDHPTYLRVSREKSLNITNEKTKFEIGKANVLDNGHDVTIIACGLAVQFALEAKDKLLEENIDAAVINLHTIKPIDKNTIVKFAKQTGAIVTAEEHQVMGGMGSAVSEILTQFHPVPQEFVGVKNTFAESGDGYELLKKYGVSTQEILKAVRKVIKRKNQ